MEDILYNIVFWKFNFWRHHIRVGSLMIDGSNRDGSKIWRVGSRRTTENRSVDTVISTFMKKLQAFVYCGLKTWPFLKVCNSCVKRRFVYQNVHSVFFAQLYSEYITQVCKQMHRQITT